MKSNLNNFTNDISLINDDNNIIALIKERVSDPSKLYWTLLNITADIEDVNKNY